MTDYALRDVQARLKALGFDPGPADNIPGPRTDAAIIAYKRKKGLAARPYLGPITLGLLFGEPAEDLVEHHTTGTLPWMDELKKHLGLDEKVNNAELRKWLKSDGATLGDPAKLPWCGDCMETAVRLALPNEWAVTDRTLRSNPYWALNWAKFGVHCPPSYGALSAFNRDGGGHIAALAGYDPVRKRFWVLGGNQSNRVSYTWIEERRMATGCPRRPATWDRALPPLPIMNSKGQIVSKNEA